MWSTVKMSPQMRILAAVEAVDFRNGIDGLPQTHEQRTVDAGRTAGQKIIDSRYPTSSRYS